MKMRWILTWKTDETTGDPKAKARLVIKGFTDPDLVNLRCEAPTLSHFGRQCLYQFAACHHWNIIKGDVKTAFLSGDKGEGERDVYAEPSPELAAKLNLTIEQLVKIEGGVYGLRNAPRRWWTRVVRTMIEQTWTQHAIDKCLFMLIDETTGNVIALAGVYVDDFLIAGGDHPYFQKKLKELRDTFEWGLWLENDFTFCGIETKVFYDRIEQKQETSALELEMISIGNKRRNQHDDKTTPHELSQHRGVGGSCNWLSTQTRADLAVGTSILQGNNGDNRVKHLT